jgi:Icc-related predicted phosphoesterase
MKIGVLSDTHASHSTEALSRIARGAFSDVSLIIHAGDLTNMSVLDAFSDRQVIAVRGNRDRKPTSDFLPEKQRVDVNGYRIGLSTVGALPGALKIAFWPALMMSIASFSAIPTDRKTVSATAFFCSIPAHFQAHGF